MYNYKHWEITLVMPAACNSSFRQLSQYGSCGYIYGVAIHARMLVATEQKLSPGEASGANLESHTLVLQVAYFKVSVNKFCLQL